MSAEDREKRVAAMKAAGTAHEGSKDERVRNLEQAEKYKEEVEEALRKQKGRSFGKDASPSLDTHAICSVR